MKLTDIASQYRLDRTHFETWLATSGFPVTRSKVTAKITGVDESIDVDSVVTKYQEFVHAQLRQQEAAKAGEVKKQEAVGRMLITSGFNFDGYSIVKYSGYISGDDAVQIDRGTGGFFSSSGTTDVGSALMAALTQIRRRALMELKEAAYALGCNAVIGVDFDYLTLDPETASAGGGTLYLPYVFGVTANGNAVVIEKNI